MLLTRSPSAPVRNPDARVVRQHLDFGAEDFFAEDWLNLRPHLPRNSGASSMGSDFWLHLTKTLPVLTLAWNDPSELPDVAAAAFQGNRQ